MAPLRGRDREGLGSALGRKVELSPTSRSGVTRTARARFLLTAGGLVFLGGSLAGSALPDPLGVLALGCAGLGVVVCLSGFLLYYNGRYADDPGGQ
jgi:hypothetical protein